MSGVLPSITVPCQPLIYSTIATIDHLKKTRLSNEKRNEKLSSSSLNDGSRGSISTPTPTRVAPPVPFGSINCTQLPSRHRSLSHLQNQNQMQPPQPLHNVRSLEKCSSQLPLSRRASDQQLNYSHRTCHASPILTRVRGAATTPTCEPTYAKLNYQAKSPPMARMNDPSEAVVINQPKHLSVVMEQSLLKDESKDASEFEDSESSQCPQRSVSRVGDSENSDDSFEELRHQKYNMNPLYCSLFGLCVSLLTAPYTVCCSLLGVVHSIFGFVEHRRGDIDHYRRFQAKSRCCTRTALCHAILLPTLTIVLVKLILGRWPWQILLDYVTFNKHVMPTSPSPYPLLLN